MEKFGIVEAVKAECLANDWHFILSFSDFESNIQSDLDNADGKNLLVFDCGVSPSRHLGRTEKIDYDCRVFLGRKFDPNSDTSAELSESHAQKYDRRLHSLLLDIDTFLNNLICNNDLTSSSESIRFKINDMDLNADYVAMDVVFSQNV